MPSAADALLVEADELLAGWRRRYAGRPDLERHQVLLLALEREQLVTIAYREDALVETIALLPVEPAVRAILRQCMAWIWKDEEMHATLIRGSLLRTRRPLPTAIVFEHQLVGAVSGWVTAARQQRRAVTPPLRGLAADVMVGLGRLSGRIDRTLADELRYRSFRRYCQLNATLERTAEIAYDRLVELAGDDEERLLFTHIRDDERRHGAAFGVVAEALDDSDHVVAPATPADLADKLATISPWLVPAAMRVTPGVGGDPGSHRVTAFGTNAPVHVERGGADGEMEQCVRRALDAATPAGSPGLEGARVAIRTSFMLGYDRRDRSNVVNPDLLGAVAAYFRDRGAVDVAVLEAPTVYGRYFQHRSVDEVAGYFGLQSPHYRMVDVSADQQPFPYQRGLIQSTISRTWYQADVRVVVAKLRTDPTEFGHLCLCTLEGMASQIDETFYAPRQLDFRTATMMLLDAAPPDLGIVDAWGPLAVGPLGVMGCRRPAFARRIYAGVDVLATDRATLRDMGLDEARRSPIIRRAMHWFGVDPEPLQVTGGHGPLGADFHDPWSKRRWRALSMTSYPVYAYLSGEGKVFVPAMDQVAFPPRGPVGLPLAAVRRVSQLAFGLRPGRSGQLAS